MPDAANQRGDAGGQEWRGVMEWKVWSGLSYERGERNTFWRETLAKRAPLTFVDTQTPAHACSETCTIPADSAFGFDTSGVSAGVE